MYVQDELGETLATDELQKLTKGRELLALVNKNLA